MIHSYEPYGHHTAYETLIEEYYDKLVQIEDYFRDADKDLVVALIDDKTLMTRPAEWCESKQQRKRRTGNHSQTPAYQHLKYLAGQQL